MKKIVFTAVLVVSLVLSLVGCKQELQETRGVVTELEVEGDTILCSRIAVDGDTLLFKMTEARLLNGMFVSGDSVVVNYIEGRNDTLRALLVQVLPKASRVIEPAKESNDSLITRPVEDQESEESEQPAQPNEPAQP